MGCRMSVKVHFLLLHLNSFPGNLDEISDEQAEQFRQEIMSMEYCYQVSWNGYMKPNYCWMLYHDATDIVYCRKRK